MQLHVRSRRQIETSGLPGRSAVICMADTREQLANIADAVNVAARLNLVFSNARESFDQVRAPTIDDAHKILKFVGENLDLPHLVIESHLGIGRCQAVQAALTKIHGMNPQRILGSGTYCPLLYRLLLQAIGAPLDPEPLVSINVRVKYAPDRLRLFLLSMRRQRYENWEVVAVTDGPNPQAVKTIERFADPRIRLIQTDQPRGHWGHPYRQLGIDQCRGELIGMSNDDNYYVPGYIEQMVRALENADLATCQLVHNYVGYSLVQSGTDLGSWIGRATLVRQVPWPGNDFRADTQFIIALRKLAAKRAVSVDRPLFIHN